MFTSIFKCCANLTQHEIELTHVLSMAGKLTTKGHLAI